MRFSGNVGSATTAAEMPMIAIGWSSAQFSEPRVPAVEPVEEAAAPSSCCPLPPSDSFRNRELSIGVSVKLTSIDTRIANAIVQPNGLMKRRA